MQSLTPTGLPPLRNEGAPRIPGAFQARKGRWLGGEMTPEGLHASVRSVQVTLGARHAPMPGLGARLNFIQSFYLGKLARANFSSSKYPSSVRHPKYPVEICNVASSSLVVRRKGPLSVLCAKPLAGPPPKGPNGRRRQGAKAGPRDVEQGHGVGAFSTYGNPEIVEMCVGVRE